MDKYFYYQTRAQEHQREISRELATRHMLKEAGLNRLTSKRVMRLALRVMPAVTAIVILILLNFLR